MDIVFIGWFLIFGGLVAGLTRWSYNLIPPPPANPSPRIDPFPIAPLPGDRPDNWVDKAIARQAAQLVQVMPPPPMAQTRIDTSDTASDTPHDTPSDTARDTPPDTTFSEQNFDAVWALLDQGVRSKSEVIRSVWGDVSKTGRPGSRWMQCSNFIDQVIREYERWQLENLEQVYEKS